METIPDGIQAGSQTVISGGLVGVGVTVAVGSGKKGVADSSTKVIGSSLMFCWAAGEELVSASTEQPATSKIKLARKILWSKEKRNRDNFME